MISLSPKSASSAAISSASGEAVVLPFAPKIPGRFAFPPAAELPKDPVARKAALEQRHGLLEAQLKKADSELGAELDAKLPLVGYKNGGREAMARFDHASKEDRSWNDFSKKSFDWALGDAWPDAPADAKAALAERWGLQAEIESVRRAGIKAETEANPPPGVAEGVIWDVLGLFGLKRPRVG